MEQLAMGGVAQIVVGVAMGLMKRKRPHHDGQRHERLSRVGGPAFAGYHALDVSLDGQRHGQDEFSVACGNANRTVKSDGLSVSGKIDGAAYRDGAGLSIAGQGETVGDSTNLRGLRKWDACAAFAQPESGRGFGCGRYGDLLVVPKRPQTHTQGRF